MNPMNSTRVRIQVTTVAPGGTAEAKVIPAGKRKAIYETATFASRHVAYQHAEAWATARGYVVA